MSLVEFSHVALEDPLATEVGLWLKLILFIIIFDLIPIYVHNHFHQSHSFPFLFSSFHSWILPLLCFALFLSSLQLNSLVLISFAYSSLFLLSLLHNVYTLSLSNNLINFSAWNKHSKCSSFLSLVEMLFVNLIYYFCKYLYFMLVLQFDTKPAGLHSISLCYKALQSEDRYSFPVLKRFSCRKAL